MQLTTRPRKNTTFIQNIKEISAIVLQYLSNPSLIAATPSLFEEIQA